VKRPYRAKPKRIPTYSRLALPFRILFSIRLLVFCLFEFEKQSYDLVISTDHLTHWVTKVLSVYHKIDHISFIGYTPVLHEGKDVSLQSFLEQVNFRLFMGDRIFCRTETTKTAIEEYADSPVNLAHGVVNEKLASQVSEYKQVNIAEKEWDLDKDSIVLVFVARLSPLKNVTAAIDIIGRLPERYNLIIVGDGEEYNKARCKVNNQGLNERIYLCGMVPHKEALQHISSADGLLLTSEAEAYPSVVFEAMYFGKPVFATSVGVLPEISDPLLQIGDIDTLHRLIHEHDFEKGNKNTYEERYTVKNYTNTMINSLANE